MMQHRDQSRHRRNKRSMSCEAARSLRFVLSQRRSLSLPALGRHGMKLPPELARRQCRESCMSAKAESYSITGYIADALAFSPCRSTEAVFSRFNDELSVKKVAVVGGGPAGLCAAMALIHEHVASHRSARFASMLPSLALTIYEKRPEAMRRQHVFVDMGRLPLQVCQEVRLDTRRLEQLLGTCGEAWNVPGASVELRVLELCLQRLLIEVSQGAAGSVSVRWEQRVFKTMYVAHHTHIIGADGRYSAVRDLLMARIPRVQLARCALEVEFAYSCHLEWQHQENVHILKAHRYEKWRPSLLYHTLRRSEHPDYVSIHRSDYDAVQMRFRQAVKQGKKLYTTPFDSTSAFLDLFSNQPELQDSLRKALEAQLEGLDMKSPALITPVDQTLHRAPHLVSVTNRGPSLWLLGDAAVGLPVSKGCNLVYHIAAAGRLAAAVLAGDSDAKEAAAYETFVFEAWHGEAWREGRHVCAKLPTGCLMRDGRFLS